MNLTQWLILIAAGVAVGLIGTAVLFFASEWLENRIPRFDHEDRHSNFDGDEE